MRDYLFTQLAFEQYNEWQAENKQVFAKLKKLIKERPERLLKERGNQRL